MKDQNQKILLILSYTLKIKRSNDEKGIGVVSETKHVITAALIQKLFELKQQR